MFCNYFPSYQINKLITTRAIFAHSSTLSRTTYLLLLLSQAVPHGGHYLWHLSKGGVGILGFDVGLGVPEEQSVGRHRLHWLVRVLSLLLLWCFGFLGDVHGRRPLLCTTQLWGTRHVISWRRSWMKNKTYTIQKSESNIHLNWPSLHLFFHRGAISILHAFSCVSERSSTVAVWCWSSNRPQIERGESPRQWAELAMLLSHQKLDDAPATQ